MLSEVLITIKKKRVRVPLMKIQLFHAHVLMASKNFLSAFKTNSDDYRQLAVPVLLGLGVPVLGLEQGPVPNAIPTWRAQSCHRE